MLHHLSTYPLQAPTCFDVQSRQPRGHTPRAYPYNALAFTQTRKQKMRARRAEVERKVASEERKLAQDKERFETEKVRLRSLTLSHRTSTHVSLTLRHHTSTHVSLTLRHRTSTPVCTCIVSLKYTSIVLFHLPSSDQCMDLKMLIRLRLRILALICTPECPISMSTRDVSDFSSRVHTAYSDHPRTT